MNQVTKFEPDAFKQKLVRFQGQVIKIRPQIANSLPSHIKPEKFERTLMAAVKADPELLNADLASLINAVEKCALDGLLPDKREAAFVGFNRNYKDAAGNWKQTVDVVYMPMAYGLRKKILQSGEVSDITARVVYRREHEEGAFLYEEGTESALRHRPIMEMSEEDARDENIIAAYSMATYKDGAKSYEVMRRFEIDRVRETSQTGATLDRRGQPRRPSGPWVDHYPEMAKKTVMRRHSKTLPMSGDLIDVEGREAEASIDSIARMLAAAPETPRILPSNENLDQQHEAEAEDGEEERVDPETGEVTGGQPIEQPDEAARVVSVTVDFVGPKPGNAQHGQSWYDPDGDGTIQYAHQTARGVKWYLKPPGEAEAPAPAKQPAPAAAAPSEPQQPETLPSLAQEIRNAITDAGNSQELDEARDRFAEVQPELSKQEIKEIRELVAVRANQLAD